MGIIYTTNEIIDKLIPIFDTIPIERAVLFGSYAKGNQTLKSDVDILIDSIRGIWRCCHDRI